MGRSVQGTELASYASVSVTFSLPEESVPIIKSETIENALLFLESMGQLLGWH